MGKIILLALTLVYFVIALFPIKKENKFKIFIIYFIFLYVFLIGFRDFGGADDVIYRSYYENNYESDALQLFQGKEPLFNLIRILGKSLSLNYKFIFLVYSIITSLFIGLGLKNYIKKYNNEFKITFLLLFILGFYVIVLTTAITTMRQIVAASILFYMHSLDNISMKKRIIFWFFIICCHYGFVFVIPFELITYIKKYKVKRFTLFIIPVICYIFSKLDFSNIISNITSIFKIYDYLNFDDNYVASDIIGIVAISLFFIYLLKIINYKKYIESNIVDEKILNRTTCCQMLYFSLLFLTSNMKWTNRVSYYYMIFMPFLLFDLCNVLPVNNSSKKKIKSIVLITFYILSLYFMFQIYDPQVYQWSINLT